MGMLLLILDLQSGIDISFNEMLFGEDEMIQRLFYEIRLPRVLTALLVGAGLSIAGLNMQVLFRNPLAGPSILGVNAGATLMVAVLLLSVSGTALYHQFDFDFFGNVVLLFSIVGALGVLILIGIFSFWLRSNLSLLIAGLLFSYFSIAIVSLLQFFAKPEQLQDFIFWTFGSIEVQSYQNILLMLTIILISFFVLLVNAKRLNVFLLGNEYAQNLGVNINKVKWLLILTTAIISGLLTAICGPIAFVGLAVPHLARMLFKTNDTRLLLMGSFIIGMNLMLLSDTASRWCDTIVFPINSITALLGTPVILFYIFKNRSKNMSM